MSTSMLLLAIIVFIAQSQDNNSPHPCNDTGRDCNTTPTPNATLLYTSPPTTQQDNDHGRGDDATLPPTSPTHPNSTNIPTLAPIPIDHGRNNETVSPTQPTNTPTLIPTLPTYSHDKDTDYPSKNPSPTPTLKPTKPPTYINQTLAPTNDPTTDPTTFPPTTVFPTLSPTTSSPITSSPTTPSPTKSPILDGQYQTTLSPTPGPIVNNGNPSNNNNNNSSSEMSFSSLIEIIFIILGIVVLSAICGSIYWFYHRNKAVQQAKALNFRFNQNKQMEVQLNSNSYDEIKKHYNSKQTNLLAVKKPPLIDDNDANIGMEQGESPLVNRKNTENANVLLAQIEEMNEENKKKDRFEQELGDANMAESMLEDDIVVLMDDEQNNGVTKGGDNDDEYDGYDSLEIENNDDKQRKYKINKNNEQDMEIFDDEVSEDRNLKKMTDDGGIMDLSDIEHDEEIINNDERNVTAGVVDGVDIDQIVNNEGVNTPNSPSLNHEHNPLINKK